MSFRSLSLYMNVMYTQQEPWINAAINSLVGLLNLWLSLVTFCRTDNNAEAISKWNQIVKKFTSSETGKMSVRRLLKDIGCPKCYLENAEHLLKVDPHAVYPTSIYRRCDGEVLAKPDASLVECTMRYTRTTTAKIVNDVLNPSNPELRIVYQSLGR